MITTMVGHDGSDTDKIMAVYDVIDDCDLLHLNVRIPANSQNIEAVLRSVLPPPPGSKLAAKTLMVDTPGWATWSEADARAWFDSNIRNPLTQGRASLPTTLTLATTRIAIVALIDILDQMANMLWALARLVIAMRIHLWHH